MPDFSRTSRVAAAKGIERVIGEPAFANIPAHPARGVVSRETGEAHLLWFDQADNCTVSIFFAHGARNDLLKIHLERAEEVLRKVRAMEAHSFVRVGSVIVIPVEQCGRRA